MIKPKYDLTNKTFNDLIVLSQAPDKPATKDSRGKSQWLCECQKYQSQLIMST